MIEYLAEYGLFFAKTLTIVLGILLVIFVAAGMAGMASMRRQDNDPGHLETRSLNDVLEQMRDVLDATVLDAPELKKLRKQKARAEKAKARKKAKSKSSSPDSDSNADPDADPDADKAKRRVWVLKFIGDLEASAAEKLRHEMTAILTIAAAGDEVVLCLESAGGTVHDYGFAASQLHRVRSCEGVTLTVIVDRIAASGGYMMACVGQRILAAPFAIIGSIGVVAEIPNINRLLQHNRVDMEVLTAGEFKRTLTVFGRNTEAGREKFVQELEDIHALFKEFVGQQRPSLDMQRVATGEVWYGQRAVQMGLVDELMTSDEYLARACAQADVYEVDWVKTTSRWQNLLEQTSHWASRAAPRLLARLRNRNTWVG